MPDQDNILRTMARRVLLKNRRIDRRSDGSYMYTCPAKRWYDQQWLWDSCFHVIALCTFDTVAAKEELRSLMAGMRDDGFLPNVVMRYKPQSLHNRLFSLFLFKDGISNITQPPAVAIALERIYQTTQDKEYVRTMLPKVAAFFAYLRTKRDPEQSGLVSIIHPWETGIDSTPAFDELLSIRTAMPSTFKVYFGFYSILIRDAIEKWNIDHILKRQQFVVKHVLFNCIYAQGLRAISRLYKELGDDIEAVSYASLADKTEQAILKHCWSEKDGLFYDLSNGKQLRVPTISSLFPLLLESIPRQRADTLVAHLTNPDEFWTPYPLATVPLSLPVFSPADNKTVLWRGPVWINANWFLIKALEHHGYSEVARELTAKTKHVVAQNDTLYECYNPMTGSGQGQRNFGWSALILDLL